MRITIDLSEVYADEQSVESAIVAAAGSQLRGELDRKEGLERELRNELRSAYREAIDAQLPGLIAEALSEPLQLTDEFGGPKGQPTSLRELIHAIAKAELSNPADRYNHGRGTVLQEFLKTEVERQLRADLAAAVSEAKAEVLAAVRDVAADELSKRIAAAKP
jgi:hypothetical protein